MQMKDRQVLLTGGSGGLGIGVAKVLLAQGAKLTLPVRSSKSGEGLKQDLSATERIEVVISDLNNESSVAQLVDNMERVDALVHLVGGFSMGATHEYGFDAWQKNFALNVDTTFLLCKYSLAKMLEQGYGRIVTIGSRGALQPAAQLAAYSAAKAGVVALTQAIAQETKGTNITANIVLPSVIDTPKNREAIGTENADKWVTPESLGGVIAFLASEAAQDIRGAAIPVYGNV